MDKITIKNLHFYTYHGVNPEEKEQGQNFYLDIDYYVNIAKACHSDNVEDTVSYAKVVKCVKRVFTAEKYDLIERAAQVVAEAILDEFEEILKVGVTLKKPETPGKEELDYMAVTISRER